MNERLVAARLYLVTPGNPPAGPLDEFLPRVLEAGVDIVQLRDKHREKGLQLPLARSLQNLCQEHEALFFVNDHADLALAAGADGVHLGQKDLPTAAVRRFAGRDLLIGCSTNNAEEARRAQSDGADYVSVGRLYETGSKADTRPATLDTLRAVRTRTLQEG